MDKPKKIWPKKKGPHRATGKPHGGARPGTGRPPGSIGLPTSAIPAIKSLNMRKPDNLTTGQEDLLQQSESAIVKVMLGKVHGSIASAVLLAARTVREEICGPLTKKIEVKAAVGIASLLDDVKVIENEEKALAAAASEAPRLPAAPKGPIIRKKAAATAVLSTALTASEEPDETAEAIEHAAANGGALQ